MLAQLQPGAPPTDATADAGVMALRQQVLQHQRSAAARLRPLRGSQPALWASCLSQVRVRIRVRVRANPNLGSGLG